MIRDWLISLSLDKSMNLLLFAMSALAVILLSMLPDDVCSALINYVF